MWNCRLFFSICLKDVTIGVNNIKLLQEKLATLDSGNDYVLTVTSIQGSSKTSEKVTIHNKYHQSSPPAEAPQGNKNNCLFVN